MYPGPFCSASGSYQSDGSGTLQTVRCNCYRCKTLLRGIDFGTIPKANNMQGIQILLCRFKNNRKIWIFTCIWKSRNHYKLIQDQNFCQCQIKNDRDITADYARVHVEFYHKEAELFYCQLVLVNQNRHSVPTTSYQLRYWAKLYNSYIQ